MKPDGTLARLLNSFRAQSGVPESGEALAALQTEFDAYKASVADDVAELSEGLQVALLSVKEAESQRDELAAKLATLEAASVQAAADAAQAKLDARKAKIVAAVGTDRADAVFEATSALADAAFDAVVGAMTVAADKEAKSPLFTETGASVEANAATVDTPSKEMQILREKFGKQAEQQA